MFPPDGIWALAAIAQTKTEKAIAQVLRTNSPETHVSKEQRELWMHSESKLDANLTPGRPQPSLPEATKASDSRGLGRGWVRTKSPRGLFFVKNVTISLFRASDAKLGSIQRPPGSDISGQNSRTGEHNARKPRPGVGSQFPKRTLPGNSANHAKSG